MKPRFVLDEIHRLSKAARPTAQERRAEYLLRCERFEDFAREFQGRVSDQIATLLLEAAGSLPNEDRDG